MTIYEKAHELGEMIKESPEMQAMNDAEEAQKNDAKSEELLKEFNLKRMNLVRDMQSGKIKQEEAVIKNNEAFAEMVKQSETIKNYVETKKAFDNMVQEINQILNVYITGQDSGCTHNCSTCGGCH
ncbi:MAG: YlbF family regulator [Clostridia bacterium]|nr:YlbF family regulator [Clostridia bacterium]